MQESSVKLNVFRVLSDCILMDSFTVICSISPFVNLGVSDLFCSFNSIFDGKSC